MWWAQPNPFSLFLEADGTAKCFHPLLGGGWYSQILPASSWRGTAQPNPSSLFLEADGTAGGWVNIEQLTAFGA